MTSVQRARLVVAMGVLNLILATVALTAGAVAPSPPVDGVARQSPPPVAVATPGSSTPSEPSASTEPSTSAEPSTATPPAETPAATPASEPSVAPSAEPTPSPTSPTVALGPSATPEPVTGLPKPTPPPVTKPTPKPTPTPPTATPHPTPHPTPRPTPTPAPVHQTVKARPPCPGDSSGPPGHQKVLPPPGRPCTGGAGNGTSHGNGKNGIVFVLPLGLGSLVAGATRRLTSRRAAARRRAR